jgi:predicted dehydrogenase
MPADIDVEEFAAAFVRFENGATLMLEVSWLLHHDTPGEDMQVWLYGRDGGCHFPSAEFLASNPATRQLYNRRLMRTGNVMEPHAYECFEFARALAEGRPSPVPAEQSLQVLRILDAIYRSQEQGREIRLDEA